MPHYPVDPRPEQIGQGWYLYYMKGGRLREQQLDMPLERGQEDQAMAEAKKAWAVIKLSTGTGYPRLIWIRYPGGKSEEIGPLIFI